MKIVKFLTVLTLALLGTIFNSGVQADDWNKKTVMTFSQPFEIPGQILPAGTYTIKLVDLASERHIVQFLDADGIKVIATVLAIDNWRLRPTGKTVVNFAERVGDNPEALKAWFYPGDNFGQEFVYPKHRAIELAVATKEPVPAIAEETPPADLKTAPIVAVTPEQKEVPVKEEMQPTSRGNHSARRAEHEFAEDGRTGSTHCVDWHGIARMRIRCEAIRAVRLINVSASKAPRVFIEPMIHIPRRKENYSDSYGAIDRDTIRLRVSISTAASCCFLAAFPRMRGLYHRSPCHPAWLPNLRLSQRRNWCCCPLTSRTRTETPFPGSSFRTSACTKTDNCKKSLRSKQEDTPVTVGLIVDHSRSMGPKLPEVAAAVSAFAQSSNPQDEMFVVDFNDDVSVELLNGKPFTSDHKNSKRAVSAVSARGRTALYDAVAEGLIHSQLGHWEKKALIVVSDGGTMPAAKILAGSGSGPTITGSDLFHRLDGR